MAKGEFQEVPASGESRGAFQEVPETGDLTRNLIAGADVVAGIPMWLAKMGARGIEDIIESGKAFTSGKTTTTEEILKRSSVDVDKALSGPIAQFLSHPIHSLTGIETSGSMVDEAMQRIGKAVEAGGGAVGLSPEITKRVSDIAMVMVPKIGAAAAKPFIQDALAVAQTAQLDKNSLSMMPDPETVLVRWEKMPPKEQQAMRDRGQEPPERVKTDEKPSTQTWSNLLMPDEETQGLVPMQNRERIPVYPEKVPMTGESPRGKVIPEKVSAEIPPDTHFHDMLAREEERLAAHDQTLQDLKQPLDAREQLQDQFDKAGSRGGRDPWSRSRNQRGEVDPRLLAGLTAVGVSALAYNAMDLETRRKVLEGLGLAAMLLSTKDKGGFKFKTEAEWKAAMAERGQSTEGMNYEMLKKARIEAEEPAAQQQTLGELSTAKDLAKGLHQTIGQYTADTVDLHQYLKAAKLDGVTDDLARDMQDYNQARMVGEKPAVSESFKTAWEKWSKPLQDKILEARKSLGTEEATVIINDFSNRIARYRDMLSDALKERQGEAGGAQGFGRKAGAEKSRTVYQLRGQDGVITIKRISAIGRIPGGWAVSLWVDGTAKEIGIAKEPIKPGSLFNGRMVTEAKQVDIETHTPIKYMDNALAIQYMTLNALKKAERERKFIDKVVEQGTVKEWMMPEGEKFSAPPDFRELSGYAQQAFPAFKDKVIDPRFAEVMEDFANRYRDSGVLDTLNNAIIRAMMINPYPHFRNELAHWFIARGASGWLTPAGVGNDASLGWKGLGETVLDSIKSVYAQDSFQKELLRQGGYLLAPSTRNAIAFRKMMEVGWQEAMADSLAEGTIKGIAAGLGIPVARLVRNVSDHMQTVMWASRDMMYTQLVKEQMAMGKTMTAAVWEVGRHMPEYYIPPRIGEGLLGEKGSRMASQAMQSRLFIFGRYHYGWLRALGENVKELVAVRNGDMAKASRGVDHLLGMTLGGYILYKGSNVLWSAAFGQPAEERLPGVYHGLKGFADTATGKRDMSAVLGTFLTFNPALSIAYQTVSNRDRFGHQIVPQGSSPGEAVFRAARYATGQFTPIQGLQREVEGKSSAKAELARLVDVKLTTLTKQHEERLRTKSLQERGKAETKRLEKKYFREIQ